MEISNEIREALERLSSTDRHLVASTLADTQHMIDEDMGDNPKHRHEAYTALSKLLWQFAKSEA